LAKNVGLHVKWSHTILTLRPILTHGCEERTLTSSVINKILQADEWSVVWLKVLNVNAVGNDDIRAELVMKRNTVACGGNATKVVRAC